MAIGVCSLQVNLHTFRTNLQGAKAFWSVFGPCIERDTPLSENDSLGGSNAANEMHWRCRAKD